MTTKILIATSTAPDRGAGISTYTREISMELCRRGIKVYYASPAPSDRRWIKRWDITHFSTEQTDSQIDKASELLKLVTNEKIDAAINNDNATLQSLAPALPCPMITVGHIDRFAIAKAACYNVSWVDYVVTISNDMQQNYVQKFGIPLHKCPIIHNGLSDPGKTESVEYNGNRRLRVVFAGEYSKRKGGDLVATAIETEHPAWERLQLDWYGHVPHKVRSRLEKQKTATIHGRVPRDELLSALTKADIFLLASRAEGCPMAMLEAMSLGVVPIASDGIGAMRWLITSGYEGYICNIAQWPSQALACLGQLATSPSLLNKMKRQVRSRFLTDFTIEKVVDRLLDLISSPTVDRTNPLKNIKILKWHRNSPDLAKPTIIDRFCYRFGILRHEGWLDVDDNR